MASAHSDNLLLAAVCRKKGAINTLLRASFSKDENSGSAVYFKAAAWQNAFHFARDIATAK
jgi:hypothetical protein